MMEFRFPQNFTVKTFHVKYDNKLSSFTKLILQSFQFKYLYYVLEDISYLLKSVPSERDTLLQIFHSIVLSLQNNLCVNFFDIWIYEIYITDTQNSNKVKNYNAQNSKCLNSLTIKLACQVKPPPEKTEIPW
uniref:hypothetical protein n=1 Tax=Lithodesmioides polymorpha TaxID=1003075 RepID=UPI00223810DA|nr:hypothetical protein ON770_pgp119 [Lithodesmioides polymorpha]UYC30862.1 hypothetical protein [Lithodesmioides polymorpha]